MNNIRIFKVGAVGVYVAMIIILWHTYAVPDIFNTISISNAPTIAIHVLSLIVASTILLGMIFVFSTNHFAKRSINKKIQCVKQPLGDIALTKCISYQHSKHGNYVKMRFCSEGVPVEVWQTKQSAVQSAINYTVLGNIEYEKSNWGIIVFKARKGRIKINKEVLYDEL